MCTERNVFREKPLAIGRPAQGPSDRIDRRAHGLQLRDFRQSHWISHIQSRRLWASNQAGESPALAPAPVAFQLAPPRRARRVPSDPLKDIATAGMVLFQFQNRLFQLSGFIIVAYDTLEVYLRLQGSDFSRSCWASFYQVQAA
jgi:hypothetical protein